MSDAEIVAKVREMVSAVDMHRNREKREVLDAIRVLVGVVEKAPEPAPVAPVVETPAEPVVEAEPVATEPEAAADPAPAAPADAPAKRKPGRPPRVAADPAPDAPAE